MSASAFLQAARGPIILITVGCLFAADHSDVMAFSRSWPVVIIVFGLMKLLEMLARRPALEQENRGNLP
jgi:hypothetical protein